MGEIARPGGETLLRLEGLQGGDQVRLITDLGSEEVLCELWTATLELRRCFPGAKFARFEVLRQGARIVLSNPIFFAEAAGCGRAT